MRSSINAAVAAVCAVTVLACACSQAAYWTEKAQNPSWFPYLEGSGDAMLIDLGIPYATNTSFQYLDSTKILAQRFMCETVSFSFSAKE